MAYFEFVHNIGLHAWDIPALIMLVLIVVMALAHKRDQAKREAELEAKISTVSSDAKGTADTR